MAKKFLTLNIGAATIELAEYDVSAKGALTLINYGTAALAAPLDGGDVGAILSPALLGIVREKGIRPGPVAVSVSGQMVFPRFAAIPMAGGEEKFEQMVRYEIEQNIPFPIDEMVCDRQVLGDTENGDKSVMIVAAKVDQIEEITSALVTTGFQPMLVDVAPIALTNVVRHNRPEDDGCIVILDIGAKTTSLVIVEGDKVYNRSIPVAGNAITKEIATALGCTTEEAEQLKLERAYVSMGGVTEDDDETTDRIAKACRSAMTRLNAEISRSINFYRSQQGGSAPTAMFLTGGSALLPQIDVFFSESLGIAVEFFNPFESIAVGSKVDSSALEADGALIAATAGLALHEAGLARFAINLLPPSIVEERAERAKIPYLIAAGVCLVGALALVMLAGHKDTEVIVAQRDAVSTKVSALTAMDRKVTEAAGRVAAAEADSNKVKEFLTIRGNAVARMNAVRDSLMPGMWIDKWDQGRVTVRYWKDRIKVASGKTPSELVVDKLKGRPSVDPASVKISDMSAVGKDAQLAQFTIEVAFK